VLAFRIMSICLCLVWFTAAGAASAETRDEAAKPKTATSGVATIYFLRPTPIIGVGAPDIIIDGHKVGDLPVGTYFVVRRPPGHDTFEIDGGPLTTNWRSEVDIAAGRTYFIEIGPVADSIGTLAIQTLLAGTKGQQMPGHSLNPGYCFYSLDEEHGRAEIAKLKNTSR
jgi:hypothetical protein